MFKRDVPVLLQIGASRRAPPAGLLLTEDFDRARRNANMKREIFYQGAKPERVKENRRG
jgi:hypothetical protein